MSAGAVNIIGQTTSFVAVHKDRPKVVHVAIRVSKISGIGEDTCYLGYLEVSLPPTSAARTQACTAFALSWMLPAVQSQEVAPQPDTANAWLMLGSESVVAVDEAFTNAFGWK